MFPIALFSTAPTWEHSKCSSTDERINKRWFIHKKVFYYLLLCVEQPWRVSCHPCLTEKERVVQRSPWISLALESELESAGVS